ncbi:MAG: hypothetical protein ACYDCK_05305 [Thermoplasmatota archaeon]
MSGVLPNVSRALKYAHRASFFVRVIAALVVAAWLSGCLAGRPAGDLGSGIAGVAMVGPTCPVERNPPDPNCADRPYRGNLTVTSADGSIAVKTFSTDADGRFNVTLAAGTYAIRSENPNGLPRCASNGTIAVRASAWTTANVSCDSGIR